MSPPESPSSRIIQVRPFVRARGMPSATRQLPSQLTPQRPVLGRLNQGVVFSCAQAEGYEQYKVYGLTITARCDIAQDKAEMYSYLSVVNLRAWWHVDGFRILCDRARRQQLAALRAALKQAGHSPSIADTESPSRILQVLFSGSNAAPPAKLGRRISTVLQSIERVDDYRDSGATVDHVHAVSLLSHRPSNEGGLNLPCLVE